MLTNTLQCLGIPTAVGVSLEMGLEREPFVGSFGLDPSSPLCLLQNPDNQIVQTSKEMRTSNHCPTVSALAHLLPTPP